MFATREGPLLSAPAHHQGEIREDADLEAAVTMRLGWYFADCRAGHRRRP
ncbi:hypothetical protein OG235_47170 [Streptomyces sp. NBC_00024]